MRQFYLPRMYCTAGIMLITGIVWMATEVVCASETVKAWHILAHC